MPYNQLFIAADDLCSVDRMLKLLIAGFELPNLKRLADEGTDFARAYCVVPICEPARNAVMTGASPADSKSFDLNYGWQQFAKPENLWMYQLRRAGYFMSTAGKIFHGYTPEPDNVYAALYDVPKFPVVWNPGGTPTDHGGLFGGLGWDDETNWYDRRIVEWTIQQLETTFIASGKANWCAQVGFHNPHQPFNAPNRFFDMIDMADVIIPADWAGGFDTLPFANRFVGQTQGDNIASTDPTTWPPELTEEVRLTIRNYAAGALWMDFCLGLLLDWLDASPYADNTVVTFYSDHGYHLSDHGAYHKFTLYEQAALAPMLIKVPGQTPRAISDPVSHIDLGATVLDLLGLPIPRDHRGVSLKPYIETGADTPRAIPTFWYGSVSCAFGDYRMTVYQDGTWEMFDVVADPWGKQNIASISPDAAMMREATIQCAKDWHFLLVEQAIDTSHPSNLQSFLGTQATPVAYSTSFVALGDLHPKGRSPGWQRMYSGTYNNGDVITLPPHIEDFTAWSRSATVSLTANDLSNHVDGTGTFYLGAGDDSNTIDAGAVTIYGGAGHDLLMAGPSASRLFGESGNDTLTGGNGADFLDGGSGDDLIAGGNGNDTLIGGQGRNTLDGGAGNDLLISSGEDTLTGGSGSNVFRIMRTGQTKRITDLTTSDTIDLADWAVIQPVSVSQVGPDVEVTAALEKIICLATSVATVRARITGAALA